MNHDTDYYVSADNDAIKDISGCKTEEILANVITFTSPTEIQVTSTNPANGAANVINTVSTSISFDRDIYTTNSGNIDIKYAANSAIAKSYPLTSDLISGNVITLDIQGWLFANTSYTVSSEIGIMKDDSGITWPTANLDFMTFTTSDLYLPDWPTTLSNITNTGNTTTQSWLTLNETYGSASDYTLIGQVHNAVSNISSTDYGGTFSWTVDNIPLTEIYTGNIAPAKPYIGGTPLVNQHGSGGSGQEVGTVGNVLTSVSPTGGDGFLSNITGTPTYYGGGGAGGVNEYYVSSASGGLGGGGNTGANRNGTNGLGGGGAGYNSASATANVTTGCDVGGVSAFAGGSGGSGVAIIRYRMDNPSITSSGGSISTVDGWKIHTFTSSGTFTVSDDVIIEYLLVGGGGAGGWVRNGDTSGVLCGLAGGGGGAGAVTENTKEISAGSYTITVGSGGSYTVTFGGFGPVLSGLTYGGATIFNNTQVTDPNQAGDFAYGGNGGYPGYFDGYGVYYDPNDAGKGGAAGRSAYTPRPLGNLVITGNLDTINSYMGNLTVTYEADRTGNVYYHLINGFGEESYRIQNIIV